jgi:hypothetical protein
MAFPALDESVLLCGGPADGGALDVPSGTKEFWMPSESDRDRWHVYVRREELYPPPVRFLYRGLRRGVRPKRRKAR